VEPGQDRQRGAFVNDHEEIRLSWGPGNQATAMKAVLAKARDVFEDMLQ
jgi:hypothetical protein